MKSWQNIDLKKKITNYQPTSHSNFYWGMGECTCSKSPIFQVYLSLFLVLNSTSSLAYTFFAILLAWSLAGWALDTNTMNHSFSSFWIINFKRGLRMVLNSSRSWEQKIRVKLHIRSHNWMKKWTNYTPIIY